MGGVGGGWGRDGLNGYKANLSPAKLKLADIGLELSLAIKVFQLYDVDPNTDYEFYPYPKIVH